MTSSIAGTLILEVSPLAEALAAAVVAWIEGNGDDDEIVGEDIVVLVGAVHEVGTSRYIALVVAAFGGDGADAYTAGDNVVEMVAKVRVPEDIFDDADCITDKPEVEANDTGNL
jgi:hypothetical protein